MPIGIASPIGRTEGGLAPWSLRVHGAGVSGRWLIIGGRYGPPQYNDVELAAIREVKNRFDPRSV